MLAEGTGAVRRIVRRTGLRTDASAGIAREGAWGCGASWAACTCWADVAKSEEDASDVGCAREGM